MSRNLRVVSIIEHEIIPCREENGARISMKIRARSRAARRFSVHPARIAWLHEWVSVLA